MTPLLLTLSLFLPSGQAPKGQPDPAKPKGPPPMLVLDPGGHTPETAKLLFTPDNKQLISVGDKTIRIWNVESGEQVRVLRPPSGPGMDGNLTAAALSPDGQTLAVGGYGYWEGNQRHVPIYLIDLNKNSMKQVLRGHTDTITSLAFSADGTRLASVGLDTNPRVWNLDKDQRQLILQLLGAGPVARHVAFSPDGLSLAVVGPGDKGAIFDLARAEVRAPFQPKGIVRDMAWSQDGKTIVTVGGAFQLWNSDGSLRFTKDFKGEIYSVAFSTDSRKVLYAPSNGGGARIYDIDTDKEQVTFPLGFHPRCALSANGSLAAFSNMSTTKTNDLRVFKTDGTIVHKLGPKTWHDRFSGRVFGWSPDGKSLAWLKGSSFNLGDLQFGIGLKPEDIRSSVTEVGQLSLKKAGARQVNVVKKGAPDVALKHTDFAKCYTILGKDRVVIGDSAGNLQLFHAGTGERLRQWRGHNGSVSQVAPSPDGRYCLSYSPSDSLLHIWSPQQDRPLVSVFIMGPALTNTKATGDWVAWTPEGFYAASPGAEKLIAWHIDNGPNQLAGLRSANEYRKLLYRPDIIKRLLELGSLEKALEAVGEKASLKDISDIKLPTIAIASPGHGSKLAKTDVTVEAKITQPGNQAVQALQLLVDGRPHLGDEGVLVFKAGQPILWKVTLPPGPHILQVLAHTKVGTARTEEIEVYTPVPKKVDSRPALYVLAVGINTYKGDWKLNFAANDAQKLAATLTAKGQPIFRAVEVKPLLDKAATRQGVLDGLTWLHKQMKAQDVAVIFFAGHGGKDDKGRFFLLPVDMDVSKLAATCVSGEELRKRLAEMPGRVLVLLDACHSGTIGAKGQGGITDVLARDLADDDCGVVVMCAAMAREEAGEERKLGHGYFALALIEGLSGKADVSKKDKCVYLHHLEQYVIDRVQELSQDEQHPVSGKPTTVRSFALARP